MKITIDVTGAILTPKRGDLLHTNVGNRRERTCMILAVHRVRPIKGVPRFVLWAERWWQLEALQALSATKDWYSTAPKTLVAFRLRREYC